MLNIDDLRKQIAVLSDEALLETNLDDLVPAAREAYEAEAASRGLAFAASASASDDAAGEDSEAAAAGTGLVSVARYETVEEARFARALLENEGIPVWFAGELEPGRVKADPLAGLELLTHEEHLGQAQLALSTEISEEELARQAKEAGMETEL